MGVFEEQCAVRASIIVKLWVSEGFLKPIIGKSLETVAHEYLKELVDRNLILVHVLGSTGNVKYYKIRSLSRDLCLREARKQRFYHVVGLHGPRGTCSHRRIVIPRGTSRKKVVDALESMPRARSYISDDESVSRLPNLRFLRIYESYDRYTNDRPRFELRNMFELVNSRYLNVGVHCRLELPSSINLLWNLQTLIVDHPRKVTAPVEIWKMHQLRHLHFCRKGLYLPDPPSDYIDVVLENLQTLKGVRNFKCDEEMVRRIPNIMKLGLKYDKDDGDKGTGLRGDYYCFGNFECLYKLESLSYKDNRLEDYLDMITFPQSLRKLSLQAKLFVWQDVLEKIGSLPLLEKLTLLGGQFRRDEWETVEGRFLSLKSLKLVANLEYWRVESSSHFPCLERLYLGGLMEEIPAVVGHISTLQSIVLFRCNESVAMSAKRLVEEQEELQGEDISLKVSVLLSEKNEALQSLANPNFQVLIIVLDDMWSIEAWEKVQCYFPEYNNSSRILVTTRLSNLGSQLDNNYSVEMKCLDKDSSWILFSKIVFKEGSCPVELEKIGKKIVENCRGLPLSIVVMGGLLEKLEHTKKCWETVRRNSNSLVNSENNEHCLKILKVSYNHLPVYLKPCFLYMGVFEEGSAILVSKVIKLWVSEGFLRSENGKSLEIVAKECLKELIDRNLVRESELGSTGNVKHCRVHDLLRDVSLREAQKQRFYHVVGGLHSPVGIYSQRRIVIPRITSKKKVVDALESSPHARSYISDNESAQRMPNSRLLRIFEAYEKRVYRSKRYVLRNMFELVNSRYQSVGAHHRVKLPSSINLIWNMQTLTVAHPRDVTAPVEIWKMFQLRHLHFCENGLYLPDPPADCIDVVLENLQTLKGVRNFKCDEEMVQRIPNIRKLGLIYDKGIVGLRGDYYCFGNLECLHKLESLSYKDTRLEGYVDMVTFPQSLRKLCLEVTVFVWQVAMEKIGSLPRLQKLKLISGQFRRGEWEIVEGGFPSLKFLSLSCFLNLEYWVVESSSHFPCLEQLHLVALEKLKEIPTEIGEIATLRTVVLISCSETAVKSMKSIVEEQKELQGEDLSFKVGVVFSKKNEALQSLASPNFHVYNLSLF